MEGSIDSETAMWLFYVDQETREKVLKGDWTISKLTDCFLCFANLKRLNNLGFFLSSEKFLWCLNEIFAHFEGKDCSRS